MALRKREAQPRAEEYPVSDGVPMDNDVHNINIREYLLDSFGLWCKRRDFTAYYSGNSFVYYGPRRKHDVVGPDLYIVNGGERRGQPCWIVEREGGLKPTLAMEFLSDTTRVKDETTKLALYRDKLRCRDYFLVDDGPVVRGFHLHGREYVPVEPDADGRLACSSLPLKVGVHDGWVRWFEPDGMLLPTSKEIALEAQAQVEQERAQAEQARAQAEQERAQAEQARAQAERAQTEAEQAQSRAAEAEARAELARAQAEALRRELEAARAELERLREQNG